MPRFLGTPIGNPDLIEFMETEPNDSWLHFKDGSRMRFKIVRIWTRLYYDWDEI